MLLAFEFHDFDFDICCQQVLESIASTSKWYNGCEDKFIHNDKHQWRHNIMNLIIAYYNLSCFRDISMRSTIERYICTKEIPIHIGFDEIDSMLRDRDYDMQGVYIINLKTGLTGEHAFHQNK